MKKVAAVKDGKEMRSELCGRVFRQRAWQVQRP